MTGVQTCALPIFTRDKAEALHRVEELDRSARFLAGELALRPARPRPAAASILDLTVAPASGAPEFTSHPRSVRARLGSTVTFTAAVNSGPGTVYTWYVRGGEFCNTEGPALTLTNLTAADWRRIEEQRLSPLYVSVHATEPELRSRLLVNPRAGLLLEQPLFHFTKAPLRKIGRGCDADHSAHARTQIAGQQQGEPPAHGGTNQDDGARGQVIDNQSCIIAPAGKGSILKCALAFSTACIVETQQCMAGLLCPCVERDGLAPLHVRCIAGQEDNGRLARCACAMADSELQPVCAGEPLRQLCLGQNRSPYFTSGSLAQASTMARHCCGVTAGA